MTDLTLRVSAIAQELTYLTRFRSVDGRLPMTVEQAIEAVRSEALAEGGEDELSALNEVLPQALELVSRETKSPDNSVS